MNQSKRNYLKERQGNGITKLEPSIFTLIGAIPPYISGDIDTTRKYLSTWHFYSAQYLNLGTKRLTQDPKMEIRWITKLALTRYSPTKVYLEVAYHTTGASE